jgi:putative tryptophan/tyrosine transport system substrate-binding protein
MKRRAFIAGLGSAAAWPIVGRAQDPGRVYRIAVLFASPAGAPNVLAFFDELRANGFNESQNLRVDGGGFGLSPPQLPEVVGSIAKSPPDVVFCAGDQFLRPVQAALSTVPVVGFSRDMLEAGFVHSFAHPGGNITGVSMLDAELDAKRLNILMDAVPNARKISALADPDHTSPKQLEALQSAAHARGIELTIFNARVRDEITPAMDEAVSGDAGAIHFLVTPLFVINRDLIIKRANTLRVPAIYDPPEIAESGGLIGYGPRLTSVFHQTARQVVKVLRGVNPADIPVEQPTNFELVINLQAAKAIGYEVPAGLLARADEVIE